MVDQMTIQTIGILLTGITLSIAAIYYTLTLRYKKKPRSPTRDTASPAIHADIQPMEQLGNE